MNKLGKTQVFKMTSRNMTINCLFIYHWIFKVKKPNLIYPDTHQQFEHSVFPMKPLFAPASDLFTNFINKDSTLSHVLIKSCLDLFGNPLIEMPTDRPLSCLRRTENFES